MCKLKITKGEWKFSPHAMRYQLEICTDQRSIAVTAHDLEEDKANGSLFVDAANTANKCGLLPSELLKQRDELLKALEAAFKYEVTMESQDVDLINKTIDKVKEGTHGA